MLHSLVFNLLGIMLHYFSIYDACGLMTRVMSLKNQYRLIFYFILLFISFLKKINFIIL